MATHVYTTGIDGPSGSSFALRIFSGNKDIHIHGILRLLNRSLKLTTV